MSEKESPWLNNYPQDISFSLQYPPAMLHHFLMEASLKVKKRPAIRYFGRSMTYEQLYQEAVQCANMLIELGVQKGDRVSIMLPNIPQAVICYYGVLIAGGVVVQTNPLYVERELQYQLNDAEVETIIALDLLYPKIAKIKAKTPLKNIIITRVQDYLPFIKKLLYPYVKKQPIQVNISYGDHVLSLSEQLKDASKTVPYVEREQSDLALLQYTGGTTGLPKGVMLTHRNLVVNAYQCSKWLYKSSYGKEKILGVVPFFHVYGMTTVMNYSVMSGATMIILPRFEVDTTLKTISKEKPTIFPGAPTMYIALLNDPKISTYNLSSIKACISGSASLPLEIQQSFERITKGKLVEGYGLTEASPVTHCNPIWGKRVLGSIGLPWPNTQAKIVSLESSEEIPVGEVGELIVKGPQVMQGYWKRPEETAEAIQDGWLYTGDLGYRDERGYFYIVDRKKEMIIAGGYNIYPREVEEVLYEHLAVRECAVVGVTDAYRGETVAAYIVLKEGEQATETELDSWCRSRLAAYKVPRIYRFREELPKSIIGKILKRKLLIEENELKEGPE
jgi:long-chain acyl-CoA synthetase